MSLLLHIVPEVETAGGVPESFTADNEKDLHCVLPESYVLMGDELWCLSTGLFGYEDPCNDIDNDAGTKRQEREGDPDQADHRGIDIKVGTDASTDTPEHTPLQRAVQLLHGKNWFFQELNLALRVNGNIQSIIVHGRKGGVGELP